MAESPGTSIRHRAQELDITEASLQRILQLTQLLLPDHAQRREFTNWILEPEVNTDFAHKIIFRDKAYFHLDGFVDRQNCCIWDSEKPQMINQKTMHPKRVIVWCALWSEGIIGPFFFEDEAGNAVTVNGERYRPMITQFFVPQLEDIALDDMWFQQEGVTCHTDRETLVVLHELFPGRVVSRSSDHSLGLLAVRLSEVAGLCQQVLDHRSIEGRN